MLILDPDQTEDAVDSGLADPSRQPPSQLPPNVREFGFIPDCSGWLPGDLLLFSAIKKNYAQRLVVSAQRKLNYDTRHSEWHHAAVYIGERYICEARPPPWTRYCTVDDHVSGHRIRVRRGMNVSKDDGYRIAIQAMKRLNMPYSHTGVFRSVIQSLLSTLLLQVYTKNLVSSNLIRNFPRNEILCSQLFHDAFLEATGGVLVGKADVMVLPAELSGCSGLIDIQPHWLRLI